MRVLIIGGGGREHALAWKLLREEPSLELLAAPGNPGIAELGECVQIDVTALDAVVDLARRRQVDLAIVGPEAPLAAGIVDRFRSAGLPIFGPTRDAAEIETSKAFAKRLMLEDGIPTAAAEVHTSVAGAKECARRFGAPVVVKASGLAAGKGVVVCATLEEAETAIDEMLEGNRFGDAGHEVLIEEFMDGEELSVFAITDGRSFITLPPLQDHKRLLEGDRGPNTGGMGAYVPVSAGSVIGSAYAGSALHRVSVEIIRPTLRALAARGRPFTGLLYAGVMLTESGPKVVEFNCRFGDPETEALVPVLDAWPLLDLMRTVAEGGPLCGFPIDEAADAEISAALGVEVTGYGAPPINGACVTTVLAAAGYPDSPRKGDVIELPPPDPDVFVFHAGTARDAQGQLVTAGGRVLAISAVGSSVEAAKRRSVQFAERVQFAGKQFRGDIGWREIARQR